MKIALFSRLHARLETRRCGHRNVEGIACKATPQRGREYCFFHDPAQKEKRRAANRTGGAHSRRRRRKRAFNPLETTAQMGTFVRELMNDVRNGEVSVRRANTLARLTPVMLKIIENESQQKEQAKYEAWVAAEAERLAAYKQWAAAESLYRQEVDTSSSGDAAGNDLFPHTLDACVGHPGVAGDSSMSKLEGSELQITTAEETSTPTSTAWTLQTSTALDISASMQATSTLPEDTAEDGPRPAGAGCATRAIESEAAMPPPKRYESKDIFIGQNFPIDMARVKLDTQNEAMKRAESMAPPGDMARKKLDAENLELKKEVAYALAPMTMKYSAFNNEGLAVAKPPGTLAEPPPEATSLPTSARDPDYEPSPIPGLHPSTRNPRELGTLGLQNRHLNYLKYAGMPVLATRTTSTQHSAKDVPTRA